MQGRLPIDAALNIVVLGTSEEIPSILAALQACRDNVVGPLNISTAQGSFEAVKQLQVRSRPGVVLVATLVLPREALDEARLPSVKCCDEKRPHATTSQHACGCGRPWAYHHGGTYVHPLILHKQIKGSNQGTFMC